MRLKFILTKCYSEDIRKIGYDSDISTYKSELMRIAFIKLIVEASKKDLNVKQHTKIVPAQNNMNYGVDKSNFFKDFIGNFHLLNLL